METLWFIIYMVVAILVSVLIPFAQFMYETDDEKSIISRITTALFYEICLFIVIGAAFFISYGYLRYAHIPFTLVTGTTFSGSTDLVIEKSITG